MGAFDLSSFPPTEHVEWLWLRLSILEAILDSASGFVWEPEAGDEDTLRTFAAHEKIRGPMAGVTYWVPIDASRLEPVSPPTRGRSERFKEANVMSIPHPTSALKAAIQGRLDLRHDTAGNESGSLLIIGPSLEIPVSVTVEPTERGERLVFRFASGCNQALGVNNCPDMSSMLPSFHGDEFSRLMSLTHDGMVCYRLVRGKRHRLYRRFLLLFAKVWRAWS